MDRIMQEKQTIDRILHDLNNTKGIEASAVLSREGLLISTTMARNAESVGAMSATMFGAAEIAAIEFGKGNTNRVIVETKFGKLIASKAGPKTLIVVIARDDSTLGHILLEVSKASEKMKEVFQNNS